MTETIFITGATGNIGAKLVVRLLETDSDRKLIVLVRGSSHEKARKRLEDVLRITEPELLKSYTSRITIVCGDITQKRFGLSEDAYKTLACGVTHVIHSAAITKFNVSLNEAREVNVSGTATVMKFARLIHRLGTLKKVAHFSTSFVCGRKDVFREDDPGDGKDFSNTYEQTKWEAECNVRCLMRELPIDIFRPSIVVGDSHTGRIIHFNVLYTPLRYIVGGQIRVLSCSPRALLDVVAVDYVVDAVLHIFLDDLSSGKTYHLVASCRTSCTVDEIITHALNRVSQILNRDVPEIRYMGHDECKSQSKACHGREKLMREMLHVFEPYLDSRVTFSDTNTEAALEGTGIAPQPLIDYADNLLEYCFRSNWGRRHRTAA